MKSFSVVVNDVELQHLKTVLELYPLEITQVKPYHSQNFITLESELEIEPESVSIMFFTIGFYTRQFMNNV
jgi:hypothetical protein